MTSEEYERDLKELIDELKDQGPKTAEKMAITGKSLVQDRIQEREGIVGATYTPLYAKAKDKRYGYDKKFVNLTATGRMFNGILVIDSFRQGNVYVAMLGGSDIEVKNKLEWNAARYGDFLQPTAEEQKEIDEVVEKDIDPIIKKYL